MHLSLLDHVIQNKFSFHTQSTMTSVAFKLVQLTVSFEISISYVIQIKSILNNKHFKCYRHQIRRVFLVLTLDKSIQYSMIVSFEIPSRTLCILLKYNLQFFYIFVMSCVSGISCVDCRNVITIYKCNKYRLKDCCGIFDFQCIVDTYCIEQVVINIFV